MGLPYKFDEQIVLTGGLFAHIPGDENSLELKFLSPNC